MREIKFKVSNGAEQVVVLTVYQDKGDPKIWWALDENDEWFMCSEPRQNTGLKDVHGREIYEGDIYSYELYKVFVSGGNVEDSTSKAFDVVEFKDGAFYHGDELLADVVEHDALLDYEGNIYENPELIDAQ